VLREHPAIAAVSVVGVPDERRGERIVACVVANNGSVTENLIAWGREQPALADHERPTEIVFFEELPRSATMAVRKATLRERLTVTETR
jgi:acyl-CoA synthetase (AMP-forming)/AMP-acid ligase II